MLPTSPSVIDDHESKFGSLADAAKLELKNNTFLSPQKFKTLEDLEDDDGESEHFAKISDTSRPRPGDFERKIEDLLSRRQLAKALKVFDEEMSDERVKPNLETFKLLIHACGKAGYAYKAKDLLNRFRSGGNRATYGMLANAFHACVNAPVETKGSCLKIAHSLRTILCRETQAALPIPLYNTMIAAFGRCGDTETAFAIIDEMTSKGIRINCETFNHLLQACISDRESGFRLAMTVYRRLLNKRITPIRQTFNLLLKATKDCGVGDTVVANDLLVEAMTSKEVRKFKQKLLEENTKCDKDIKLNDNSDEAHVRLVPSAQSELMQKAPLHPQLPNLLSKRPIMDFVTGLSANELNSSFNARLQMLGDIDGFIDVAVNEFKVEIDIKTLSLLIPFIDSDKNEEMLLSYLTKLKIKPDVDFFNQLMKQKTNKHDYQGARDVLNLINEHNLSPDIATFGCLAITCRRPSHIYQMMRDLESNNILPNVQIMTPLVRATNDPKLMIILLQFIQKHNISADAYLVGTVEKFYQRYKKILVDYEKGTVTNIKSFAIKKEIEEGLPNWKKFCAFYQNWQRKAEITLSEHPWNQYKTKRDRSFRQKKK